MPVRNLRDGIISVQVDDDGVGSPAEFEVTLEEGNLAWTERRPVAIIRDRAVLHHARRTPDETVEVSFAVFFQSFTTHSALTLHDALRGTGGAAAWLSQEMQGVDGDTYSVRLEFEIDDPEGGTSEFIRFEYFHANDVSLTEGEEFTTLAVTGTGPLLWTGPNLINDAASQMTSAVDWTLGTNWQITGGLASQTAPTASSLDWNGTPLNTEVGKTYELTYTIASRTTGSLTPTSGSVAGTARSTNGTFTETIVATAADLLVEFAADGTWDGTLDNVFVRRVSHAGIP